MHLSHHIPLFWNALSRFSRILLVQLFFAVKIDLTECLSISDSIFIVHSLPPTGSGLLDSLCITLCLVNRFDDEYVANKVSAVIVHTDLGSARRGPHSREYNQAKTD